MAKFGKIVGTGILAAAAAAGTYYLVKNKDELLQRAKDFADKVKTIDDEDIEIDFDFEGDFEDAPGVAVTETQQQEEEAQ